MIPIDTDSDLILTKSLVYDVTGKLRKDRVRLPNSILSDKPGAVPNQKVRYCAVYNYQFFTVV